MDVPREIYEQVRDEYLARIVPPERREARQFFLCPVGYVGAGKSTVLNHLLPHFSLVRLSSDESRRVFRARGYGAAGSQEAKVLYDETIEHFASQGHSIALDSNNSRAKGVIEARAKRLSALPIWIHVNPPDDFIIQKLQNFKHTWLFRNGEHAVERFLLHKSTMPQIDVPYVYTFDTSRSDLPEQAGMCITRIRQALGEHGCFKPHA